MKNNTLQVQIEVDATQLDEVCRKLDELLETTRRLNLRPPHAVTDGMVGVALVGVAIVAHPKPVSRRALLTLGLLK